MTRESARGTDITCPGCHRSHYIHVMHLTHTCKCGLYYVDIPPYVGWYRSQEDFAAGGERIDP